MRLIDFKIKLKEEVENFEGLFERDEFKKLSQMPKLTIITITNINFNIIMDEFHP
jgi:hypothetical protein